MTDQNHQAAEAQSEEEFDYADHLIRACTDFESCKVQRQKIQDVEYHLAHRAVHMYDPKQGDSFRDLIAIFSEQFVDKQEAAGIIGVSVSTFYRWKSGDTVPHHLMRATVKDAILKHLAKSDHRGLPN